MEIIMLDPTSKQPLYIQLYQYFRREIEQNRLPENGRLPSIRHLSRSLSISKITVEKAYLQLVSEGYVRSKNRSGFVVNQLEDNTVAAQADTEVRATVSQQENSSVRFDFASGEMDIDGFDFSLWKRYLNKVFANKSRLVGYGSNNGEEELRSEIAKYLHHSRGVTVDSRRIIVGAGTQMLLHTLCSLLKFNYNSVAFEEPGFKNGRQIFTDHYFDIIPIEMQSDGISMERLVQSNARLVYISPSHQFPTGYIMPVGKRNRLLTWAEQAGGIIIEDDYDSELRYFGRPIPALKGMDSGDHVVYLGSFSKIIPPSIRISYMVLPERLLELYDKNAQFYNQTASTAEQLALAKYMKDGNLDRQIRRLRKRYHEKKLLLLAALKNIMGDRIEVNESDAGLHMLVTVKCELTARQLADRALAAGCRVAPVYDYYLKWSPEKLPRVILYFSKVPASEFPVAVQLLKQCWLDE